jgi:CubicO group peptidase (beta-lactamase class C family)
VLLGILLHRVSGKFYGDFLNEHIFGPLGMQSTRVVSEADIVPHRAAGYRLANDTLKNQEWVSPSLNTTADGSLCVTVLDLVGEWTFLGCDTLGPRAFERLGATVASICYSRGATPRGGMVARGSLPVGSGHRLGRWDHGDTPLRR